MNRVDNDKRRAIFVLPLHQEVFYHFMILTLHVELAKCFKTIAVTDRK
jgi:hypothetical protein